MKFRAFEEAAREAYAEIPEHFKEGIDGLVVSREAVPHPDLPDIYTLGLCATEDYVSDWGGPETTRSQVILYWGSFQALARLDPDFDWAGELWETLTHELRHHLESLAREDGLEGVDYAADQTFKRDEGLDFDPWYYQQGDEVVPGLFQVERSYYLEQEWTSEGFESASRIGFLWGGRSYAVPRPEELGDVHFVWIHGILESPASLELVLLRRRSWWQEARRMVGTYRPLVLESEAEASPVPDPEPTADAG